QLATIYWDTPDTRLLRRNVTVRHRRSSGAADDTGEAAGLWTLKLPERAGKATFTRTELSWPGESTSMPAELADLVAGLALGTALAPVAEMVTIRRRDDLRDASGVRLAEVADDQVTVTPSGPA